MKSMKNALKCLKKLVNKMKHIKRFNETKEEKVENQEMEFNADSLEMEKDLNPDIKTEPVEHDEKELQNVKKNKIEKFNELK